MAEREIGVLIDYENVGLGSINSLFDQVSDIGRIIIKRAYADWSKAGGTAEQMLELGIEAKQHFRGSGSGKNASDISLAIDAVDLLHRSPVDTFVIVSSDTDFVPLVSTLRAAGKMVIGAGRRGVVSPALVHSCDRYIFLDDGAPTAQAHSALKEQGESLLERAMAASTDDQGQVVAAKLHNNLLRMDPSFDFRSLGHKTFTQFLASSPKVTIRRPRGYGDVLVELAAGQEQTPAGQEQTPIDPGNASVDDSWDYQIDTAWSGIPGGSMSGSKAAAEAAKVLGISKLSASRFKNLQRLLDSSELLRAHWSRDGNNIRRRVDAT